MAHNDTHAARKKGGTGKILLVVLLLLLLAVGALPTMRSTAMVHPAAQR